ncbi:hypothetical protein APHCRT_1211 [Anaplasma phagocytophilum str. CRT53-1]|uniref:Uncharacterized protein n=1 Tax=Anaplasma phagocytophilum str. CRT53-1 TaxID=1359157 RepID=A0A0F3PVD6_ANAPH|nr:hypothetical protein APHCRT_1211 [Anaplasma phagocytophilum str. CRT53-1]KJZ99213.1 hypothetical protein APHCR_0573 [Anaplasma phagocytophilum str. CR1007]
MSDGNTNSKNYQEIVLQDKRTYNYWFIYLHLFDNFLLENF